MKILFSGKNNKPLISRSATLLMLGLIAANSLFVTSSLSAQPNSDGSAFQNGFTYNAPGTFCVSPPPEDTKLVSDTPTAKVYAASNNTHVINAGKVVAQVIETDNAALTNIFGLKPKGLPFTIYMESGADGAYHCHCPDTTLLVSSPYDAQVSAAYATAEMEEVYEHAINNGWNCDFTNGESLSRALALDLHPQVGGVLASTEINWWNHGARDYISTNNAPDTNLEADGCGTLFLDYLHYRLGYDWKTIIRTGGHTLAETYAKLTNSDPSTAFRKFTEALQPFVYEGQLVLPEHSNPWDSEAEKKQLEQEKQLVWKQKMIESAERGAAGLVLLVIAAYYIWRHRHQERAHGDANQ